MTAKRYRKKPVVIEAIPYDGTNHREISLFTGILCLPTFDKDIGTPITIPTLEGEHIASVGDMIIKGVKGEFYPCKPDIFAETYEPADVVHIDPDAPEQIWVGSDSGTDWDYGWWVLQGPDDLDRTEQYIRADLAKAQAGALLRQAAQEAEDWFYDPEKDEVKDTRLRDAILAIDPDAQAALDRYVLSDPRVKTLVEHLERWLELASHCAIEEGICCCGDNMDGHSDPMNCGHSPVDHGSYIAQHLVESTSATLRAIGGE